MRCVWLVPFRWILLLLLTKRNQSCIYSYIGIRHVWSRIINTLFLSTHHHTVTDENTLFSKFLLSALHSFGACDWFLYVKSGEIISWPTCVTYVILLCCYKWLLQVRMRIATCLDLERNQWGTTWPVATRSRSPPAWLTTHASPTPTSIRYSTESANSPASVPTDANPARGTPATATLKPAASWKPREQMLLIQRPQLTPARPLPSPTETRATTSSHSSNSDSARKSAGFTTAENATAPTKLPMLRWTWAPSQDVKQETLRNKSFSCRFLCAKIPTYPISCIIQDTPTHQLCFSKTCMLPRCSFYTIWIMTGHATFLPMGPGLSI